MLFSDTNQLDDLKAFLVKWYGSYNLEYGVPEWDVPKYIPRALRELYLFAGRWQETRSSCDPLSPEIFQYQDCLYPIERIKIEDGRIDFVCENQGNWICQVNANDDDTEVFSNSRMLWDEHADGYEVCCRSLYHFLKTFCLQEIVFGCKKLYTVCIKAEGDIGNFKDMFREPVVDIWLDGYYSYPYDDGPSHSFYQCGPLLIMSLYGEIWIGYNSDDDIESVMGNIPSLAYLSQINPY